MRSRAICSIPDCGRYVDARGWCRRHYYRWVSNGDPLASRIVHDVGERLKVYGEQVGECFIWRHAVNEWGYGLTKANGRTRQVHRLAWERANGVIPDGMLVLHRCDTPACYRLEHLFLGTHQDNMDDMSAKGRSLKGRPRTPRKAEAGR